MHVRDIGILPVLGACTLYIFGFIVYRLKYHPLAKYPGPFLAKITSLYDTYHSLIGDRHLDQFRCHQKYGTFVRYNPNYIIVNSSDGARDIYMSTKNVQKSKHYLFLQDGGASSTNSVIDKTVHAQKKRLLSQGFSDSALKSLEPYMIENIDRWLDTLGPEAGVTGWSEPRNMTNYATYLTFDVLGDLCFGKSFDLITSEKLRFFPELILTRLRLFLIVSNSPFAPYWRIFSEKLHLDRLLMPEVARKFQRFGVFAAQAIDERISRGKRDKANPNQAPRKDFVYWLSLAKDPVTGEGYTQKEMWAESRLLIGAGSDTTAVTLAAGLFYLVRNPQAAERLHKEVRSTFSSVEEIQSGPRLNSCHYLRAVIDEILRITPPVGSSMPREITDDGLTIDGQFFPPGTIVGTPMYALHHNTDYHRDASKFWPERWLADEATGVTEEEVTVAKAAFHPFSMGSRGCIGKPMAYAEASIALGRVMYRFDIRLKPGDTTGESPEGLFATKDAFVCLRDGPYVQFRERQEPNGNLKELKAKA